MVFSSKWPLRLIILFSIALAGCDDSSDVVGIGSLPAECPNQPGITVDENGYCVSESQTVIAGDALTLTLDNAQLSIPAEALDAGTNVTLAEVSDGGLVLPPNGSGETLITPVYALAFSAAQLTNGKLMFTFDIPTSVTTGFYARIKIEGGLGTDGQSDTDWLIVIGEYDAQQSQLTIELSATATRFLVAGISTNAAVPSTASAGLITDVKDSESMVSRSLAAAAISPLPFPVPNWTSYGWAVLCDPQAFSRLGLTSCNSSEADLNTLAEFTVMMNNLGAKLYESDQQLTNLDFPRGNIRISNHARIENSGLPFVIYDPDNRSAVTSFYFVAYVTPNTTDRTLGYYDPSSSTVFVDKFEGVGTVIHELMHAVQHVEIGNAWDQKWIREGLASAIEAFAPSISVPNAREFRLDDGDWRNWNFPLASDDSLNEYEALEFWLSLDETLTLLPSFHNNLRGHGSMTDSNSYSLVDASLTDTGLPSLREGYTNLIAARNNDAGYLYCKSEPLTCVSGESCELPTDIAPISAHCMDMTVEFEASPECPDTPPDIMVTLVTEANPNIELMVEGVLHEANKAVPFSGEGRIWAINTDSAIGATSPVATLKFTNAANCYIKMNSQKLETKSYADLLSNEKNILTTPAEVTQHTSYQSFEDLSQESTIRTANLSRMDMVSPSVSDVNDEIVEPLELAAWTANSVANAALQCFSPTTPELCTLHTADAESSVSSDTDGDAKSLITRGEHSAFATVTSDETSTGTDTNGYARSIYNYEINNVSAELNLTWGCTMSKVRVTKYDPILLKNTVLLDTVSISSASWDEMCGTRQTFIIAPEHQVNVTLITENRFRGSITSPVYEDVGGFFEIELKAMLPPAP